MQRLTVTLVLSMLSALLLGCTDQAVTETDPGPDPGVAALAAQLPPLPPARAASLLVDYTQLGNQAALRDLNAWDEGTSLRLASSSFGIIWGIWGFSNASGATQCRVVFSGVAESEAYFAISNYASGSWEILGPLAGPQQLLDINDPSYADGAGNLYIAAIAYHGASILIDQLMLSTEVGTIQQPLDNSGGYTSLAKVNGHPAISYYDETEHDLRYVRASDPLGENWGAALTLDSTGDTGQWTSLKVVDGRPAIAYYDFTAKVLRYIRAEDADGSTWGTPVTVDPTPNCGEYCSLDLVAGYPAISYYYADGPALLFVRALDMQGSSWGLPVTVDNDGNTGQYTSLNEVYLTFDIYPAISYRAGGAGELRYARGSDTTGSAWAQPLILDTGSNAGFSTSLAVVNNAPAICYYDSSESSLRYIRANDWAGDSWGMALTLDGELEDAGDYCSLAVIGGIPMISYYNGLHGDLRLIRALDASGGAWGSSELLDESSNVIGQDTSLIDLDGVPAVSYHDQTNGKVRYMWGF